MPLNLITKCNDVDSLTIHYCTIILYMIFVINTVIKKMIAWEHKSCMYMYKVWIADVDVVQSNAK